MKQWYFLVFLALPCMVYSKPVSTMPLVARDCKVNIDIARRDIPPTPHQLSLPQFGQGIIGWGTGPEGAHSKLETLNQDDIAKYQEQGVNLLMIKDWYDFYVNETARNPCNPTAPLRAKLMYKIMQLWP